jgi:hypothetical protein
VLAFLASVAGAVLQWADKKTASDAQVTIEEIHARTAQAGYARDVAITAMGHRIFWVVWALFALPLACWWALAMGGTVHGLRDWLPVVDALNAVIRPYADRIFDLVFYTGAGMAGAQTSAELRATLGTTGAARRLGMSERTLRRRVRDIENKTGERVPLPNEIPNTVDRPQYPHRIELSIKNGVVIIGSDAHYWPGPASTAHRAFVKFAKDLEVKAVILNGDAIDAASISRHPPIGWERRPTVVEEIEACQDRLHELSMAAPISAKKIWTLGNHDMRFETRLAQAAPEFAKMNGFHLKDHFPGWAPCWLTFINDDVAVKHRFKGGIHATHNNAVWSGRTLVTGHLHSQKVTPFSDWNGTRYGVDAGCLAETDHEAFVDYTEGNPLNWRSGFAVLTFRDGRLLQPELVSVWDKSHVQFRGEIVKV